MSRKRRRTASPIKVSQRGVPSKRSLSVKPRRKAVKLPRYDGPLPLGGAVFVAPDSPTRLSRANSLWKDAVRSFDTSPHPASGFVADLRNASYAVQDARVALKRASVCARRQERKEVLFAKGRTGRGSARGPRAPKSEVTCV